MQFESNIEMEESKLSNKSIFEQVMSGDYITEALNPSVGIFYVYKNQLFIDYNTFTSYRDSQTNPNINMLHEVFWHKLKNEEGFKKLLKSNTDETMFDKDYQFLPRGRVMVTSISGKLICQITMCDCLRSNIILCEKIKNEFNVSGLHVIFSNNSNHYKCYTCRNGKLATVKLHSIDANV